MNPFGPTVRRALPPTSAPPPAPQPVLDFKRFKKDDWILIGIIFTLILEGCTDYILLCALGYLFIVGL